MFMINPMRRVMLACVPCFTFASLPISPALGSSVHAAKRHATHHKAHHKKHPTKKKSCRGDGDGDHSEPSHNDGDGCGV